VQRHCQRHLPQWIEACLVQHFPDHIIVALSVYFASRQIQPAEVSRKAEAVMQHLINECHHEAVLFEKAVRVRFTVIRFHVIPRFSKRVPRRYLFVRARAELLNNTYICMYMYIQMYVTMYVYADLTRSGIQTRAEEVPRR
jgi:hypothetical protein